MSWPPEIADAVVEAIQSGDVAGLRQLLAEQPSVASAPLGGRYKSRAPLHVVTDWPGYFPNGPEVVRLLVEAGADPNARQPGEETPLHWADLTQQAVSQHLTVLKRAGLLAERREGTRRLYSLRAEPLQPLLDEFWPGALARLKQSVERAHPRTDVEPGLPNGPGAKAGGRRGTETAPPRD